MFKPTAGDTILKERPLQEATRIGYDQSKILLFYINGREYEASGDWEWGLQSDTLFCSDVLLTPPAGFEGTRSLLHPDDAPTVREALDGKPNTTLRFLQFRVITSYGEIKTVTGRQISFADADIISPVIDTPQEKLLAQHQLSHQAQLWANQLEIINVAEKATASGTWWCNISTGEVHYSDGMFHLYRLAPQSLSTHFYTFVPFLHPDDKEIVVEALANAVKAQLPLHLQHRIIRTDKKERTLQLVTWWSFSNTGALLLNGRAQDITEQRELEKHLHDTEAALKFSQRLQSFMEQSVGAAHYTVNLVTRKFSYSDAYYRIHGIKSGAVLSKPSSFLSFVHPDDRDLVAAVQDKIIKQHLAPDIDYRLVRPDGKVRYVRQQGKLLFEGDDMMMACVLEDVTAEKVAERQLSALKEKESLQAFTQHQAEEMAGIGSWWWEVETGKITWSNHFYTLLGYKPSAELTHKHLKRAVHPDDQKLFNDNLNLVLQERQDSVFSFRLMRAAKVLHLRASFRHLHHQGKTIFMGLIQDTTHQYTLQEQLAEKALLANALTDNIPDAVFITDENNAVLLWNRHCEELFGQKKDGVLHQNFFDAFPQLKTEAILSHFNSVLGGTPVNLPGWESSMKRGRHENILMLPLRNESGAVSGILHVLHDVTREHSIQQQLGERLNFIEGLVDASVDRIIVLDRNMNYLYCNEKAAASYGVTKEEIVGKNVLEIFPDSMTKPSFEHFRRALKGETVQVPAIEGFTEDHYDQIFLIPIRNDKQQVTAVLWMHHDLSHEIKLRRQLQKSADILSNISEAYVELDAEAKLQFVNAQAEKLWGRKQGDLIGKRLTAVFPAVEGSALYAAILEAIREHKAIKGEFMSPILNRWVYISATPFGNGIILLFSDIDKVKAAQDKLRSSETLLREAEIAGHAGSYEVELPSWNMRFSEGMYRIFGYEPDAFIPTLDFIDKATVPEDIEAPRLVLERAIATRENYTYNRRIYRKDGALRHIVSHGKVVCNESGEPVKLLGTIQDITELRKTEAELGESQNLLQQTTAATPDSISIYDLQEAQPIYLNHCLAEWVGIPSEALTEMHAEGRLQLVHPEDREDLLAFNEKVKQSRPGKVSTIEYRLLTATGETLWLRNRSKIFRWNDAGEPTHFLSVLQDVTTEKNLHLQLTERGRFAETLIDASVDRMLVLDSSYSILSWNSRCEEIYGYHRGSVIGTSFYTLFPKLQEDALITNAITRAFAGERTYLPVRQEIYSDRYSELYYIPIFNAAGEADKVLHIIHDITKIYKAQKALEESNRQLEGKNRELEQKAEDITLFTHIASHDLKEPLRKVQLFGSLLAEKEASNLSSQGKDYINRSSAALQRMNHLISDLLALSQLESNEPRETVDMTAVLDQAKGELALEIETTKALINADTLPVIKGFGSQLVYLLKNLLSNAIKFSKPGTAPRITIKTFITEVAQPGESPLDYCCISVTDAGIGFDQKYAKKIFQVFQRLQADEKLAGTGMGLAICKRIMENHGGFIEAKGKAGAGASFYCYFPLVNSQL